MPRLTKTQWEQARAEYEVKGVSLGQIANRFKIATSSVSRKAKTENWTQGKLQELADKKFNVAKELAEIETQTQHLTPRELFTMEAVVQERLQAEGVLASLDIALAHKGILLAKAVTSADEWETLARGRRHIAPATEKQQPGVNVNVNQQQAQGTMVLPPPSPQPHEAVRGVLRGDFQGDE